MGTSSSSSGPKSGIPFKPSWLSPLETELSEPLEHSETNTDISYESLQTEKNIQTAPMRRFQNARKHLGSYISSGEKTYLKKALGYYSRDGMGGSKILSSRMQVSTSVGAGIFSFFNEIQTTNNENIILWVNNLVSENLSSEEIVDRIIEYVIPIGGSLEEESCKMSMAQALSSLLQDVPDVDLFNLSNDDIWFIVESFLGNEAYNRIVLDIGQLFESSKYSALDAVTKLESMREYIKAEISISIQSLRQNNLNPTKNEMNRLLQVAIENTFYVFEDEI